VRPAGGSSTGGSGIGRVKFEVEPSPALTPSWKSTSWARGKKKEGKGAEGEESPELADEGAPEFDEALK
jgi:pre-mRNA-splicing factor ATP-dependent RNA helicase DHX38/PRP16